MLKITGGKLDLISDIDVCQFFNDIWGEEQVVEHKDIAKIIQNFWNVMIKTSLLKILYTEMQ